MLARASNGTMRSAESNGAPMKREPRSWPTACNRDRPTLEAGGNSRRAGLQRARSVEPYDESMRPGAAGPLRQTDHGYLEGASTMCLNCGCMQAHNDMGKPGVNIVYEDLRKASDANGKTVEESLEMMNRTASLDRANHPTEYGLEREPAVR
jgi:hypothetical protein